MSQPVDLGSIVCQENWVGVASINLDPCLLIYVMLISMAIWPVVVAVVQCLHVFMSLPRAPAPVGGEGAIVFSLSTLHTLFQVVWVNHAVLLWHSHWLWIGKALLSSVCTGVLCMFLRSYVHVSVRVHAFLALTHTSVCDCTSVWVCGYCVHFIVCLIMYVCMYVLLCSDSIEWRTVYKEVNHSGVFFSFSSPSVA